MARKPPPARAPFPMPGTAPSIFATDRNFKALNGGKTKSQVASETVDRLTRENGGRSPGEIRGISREEKILGNRWGSPYSKPGSGVQ
jgi:hypothetical protein